MIPPFDNADVREAIRYAINYDEINTLLAGTGKIVQEVIPEGFLEATPARRRLSRISPRPRSCSPRLAWPKAPRSS